MLGVVYRAELEGGRCEAVKAEGRNGARKGKEKRCEKGNRKRRRDG